MKASFKNIISRWRATTPKFFKNIVVLGSGVSIVAVAIHTAMTAQKASLRSLLKMLHKKYPAAVIQGHRDFSPDLNKDGKITPNEWMKSCPCFNAKEEYSNL